MTVSVDENGPVAVAEAVVAFPVGLLINNPANDVPLVSGKPTYVRVYGKQIAGAYRANNVEAILEGATTGRRWKLCTLR